VTLATSGKLLDVRTHDVMPANPGVMEGVEDLTQLSYLNEPSILHDLDHRYKQVRETHSL
jgi:myosin-5